MKYEIDTHLFAQKLSALLINKGMKNKKGEPDKIALYNRLYPTNAITDEDCKKDRQSVTDKTRNISNWLKGNNYPKRISDVLELCNALNCDLDYFFTSMPAPTHDLYFISHETGLSAQAVNRLIEYDTNIKELLDCLIDFKDLDEEPDFLNILLVAMLNYGMSTGTTKIILKDSLFSDEKEISDKETVANMLKYSATQIFNTCLSCCSIALDNKKLQIQDLNLKLAHAKEEQLLNELIDATGKTKEEILSEINQKRNKTIDETT